MYILCTHCIHMTPARPASSSTSGSNALVGPLPVLQNSHDTLAMDEVYWRLLLKPPLKGSGESMGEWYSYPLIN